MAATVGVGSAPIRASSAFHCVKVRVPLATNGAGAALPESAECAALATFAEVSAMAAGDG